MRLDDLPWQDCGWLPLFVIVDDIPFPLYADPALAFYDARVSRGELPRDRYLLPNGEYLHEANEARIQSTLLLVLKARQSLEDAFAAFDNDREEGTRRLFETYRSFRFWPSLIDASELQ